MAYDGILDGTNMQILMLDALGYNSIQLVCCYEG